MSSDLVNRRARGPGRLLGSPFYSASQNIVITGVVETYPG